MPRTKISEFSATPASNTDIDSINIAEGCAPSGINDAIRELMAQLKDFQTGAVGDSFNGPVGSTTAGTGAFTTLSASGTATLSGLTASTALALDASKNIVSVTNTGTGSNVLATSPTLVTPALGTPSSGVVTNLTGTASININGTVGATTASTGAFTTLSATGVTTVQAGTAAAPAITTSGDTNTGVFFPAADTIAFTEGGVEAVRINSSGNLLIGYTADQGSGKLQVNGAGRIGAFDFNTDDITYGGGGNFQIGTVFGVPMLFKTSDTERMRILSGGNVGIGTSSPAVKLHVQGSAGQLMRVTDGTTGASIYSGSGLFGFNNQTGEDGMFGSTASHYLYFATNGAERLRLDTSGNLGLAVTPQSTWQWPAFQIQNAAFTGGSSGDRTDLSYNFFRNGTAGQNQYISTNFATNYRQITGQHQWFNAPSGTAGNAITFTQAMTLDASGNLLVGVTSANANGGVLQLKSGITFPATAVAATDANTLDDYEEGTFTPTFTSLTVVGTPTYTGTYTKVGRMVTFTLRIQSTTSTTSSAGATYFPQPIASAVRRSTLTAANGNATASYGVGLIADEGNCYLPTWTAVADVAISGFYYV